MEENHNLVSDLLFVKIKRSYHFLIAPVYGKQIALKGSSEPPLREGDPF